MTDVDVRHGTSGRNAECLRRLGTRDLVHIMLDCGRVNALRLRFPDSEPADLVLDAGVHPVGRAVDGRPGPVARADASLQFCVDRRGAWLQVREGVRGVHVNGRPVRKMAMLRAGDGVFVDGVELLLVADRPSGLSPTGEADGNADSRIVLRGVGGLNHGRCFALDRPLMIGRARDCAVRIDGPAIADHHARLEPAGDGIALHGLGSTTGSLVNGHAVRSAMLRAADQLVIGSHRFVLESASPAGDRRRPEAEEVVDPEPESTPLPSRSRVWRIPWLLLAALMLSAALALLLLYGAR
ncbi:FHA domain-containing protein [Lysobacter korlensis]|uniref:FHA domain-containing protein n=1 Tax=Lysobacter korlensis TaxID=553636 RepID=A0ABV6RL96_9GAMM